MISTVTGIVGMARLAYGRIRDPDNFVLIELRSLHLLLPMRALVDRTGLAPT